MSISICTNEDNMAMMSRYPDKFFKYGLLDPPYGIGIDGQKKSVNKNPKHNRKQHEHKGWDNATPSAEYWNEVKRVCKYLVVFGGNYFTDFLPPVKGWIFWYKGQNDLTMSDGEMIWTNLPIVTRQFTVNRAELIKQNTFHPTEKPYSVYRKIIHSYFKEPGAILDTHLGSGSSRIAAYDLGFDFYGCELDKDYFEAQEKRFTKHIAQQKLFTPQQAQVKAEQITLL
jgi:site-specific DNA-methyltransferase (adenine-specific)